MDLIVLYQNAYNLGALARLQTLKIIIIIIIIIIALVASYFHNVRHE